MAYGRILKKTKFAHIAQVLVAILFFILTACGKNEALTPPITEIPGIAFGTNNTLDVVTWNLKEFPYSPNTINYLKELIPQMNVDVIAFQEIMDQASFYALANQLPNYSAYVYNATSSYRLAYLYDIRTVTVNAQYTIFNNDSNPFPRPPYVLEITHGNKDYVLINNHFKALGDNFIDESNSYDEEVRRRLASQKLDYYISNNFSDDRVIVLGDLNDQIQEPESTNVFMAFLLKPAEYLFTTMSTALNPTYNTVSYPSYNSIIDHILITNELFDDYESAGSICRAILIDSAVGGLTTYYNHISDHRPVGIRLSSQ